MTRLVLVVLTALVLRRPAAAALAVVGVHHLVVEGVAVAQQVGRAGEGRVRQAPACRRAAADCGTTRCAALG
jgi:hypothetical protein